MTEDATACTTGSGERNRCVRVGVGWGCVYACVRVGVGWVWGRVHACVCVCACGNGVVRVCVCACGSG